MSRLTWWPFQILPFGDRVPFWSPGFRSHSVESCQLDSVQGGVRDIPVLQST